VDRWQGRGRSRMRQRHPEQGDSRFTGGGEKGLRSASAREPAQGWASWRA
jgi:hypothetical protein